MKMKDRMERLIILPFSMACASEASVCAGNKSHVNKPPGISTKGGSSSSGLRMKKKNSMQLLARPKSNITRGLQRLISSLKNFSRLFVYRGDEIKEEGEAEVEMEIGFPTDVKHLTHIGWDGSTTVNNPVKGWENLSTSEIISFPSISLKQFEFAMASQAEQSKLPPLVSNKVV